METSQPRVIYGNVNNTRRHQQPAAGLLRRGALPDRRQWACSPRSSATLPPQLAALMRTNVGVQELTVEAALTGRRDHVYQAAMLDPHTAADLDPQQIVSMVDELLEAHGDMMPEFR